jgi:hypothetical protein
MNAKHVALMALAYLGVGAAVTAWTVSLNQKGRPSFSGFGDSPSPTTILVECVALWPVAVVQNLKGMVKSNV